jgi:hypothetical protein
MEGWEEYMYNTEKEYSSGIFLSSSYFLLGISSWLSIRKHCKKGDGKIANPF